MVVVLVHGGPLDVAELQAHPRVRGILAVGHPGHGAQGIADVLFGKVAPAGRLPVTWHYENYTQLVRGQVDLDPCSCPMQCDIARVLIDSTQADFHSMDMRAWPGKTYRFLQVPPLYPFGHGLSYTAFDYAFDRVHMQTRCRGEDSGMFVSMQLGEEGWEPVVERRRLQRAGGGRVEWMVNVTVINTGAQHCRWW